MTKRPRADSHSEAINTVFGEVFKVVEQLNSDITPFKKLKHEMLSKEKGFTHKAVSEFPLEEAVERFGLTYSRQMDDYAQKHHWGIEREIEVFDPSSCLSLSKVSA